MSGSIKIGDGITITLLEVQNGAAQLGLRVPEGTPIVLTEDVKPGDPNDLGLDGRD